MADTPETQQDYFFIIQEKEIPNIYPPHITKDAEISIHAAGEGLEVINALARFSTRYMIDQQGANANASEPARLADISYALYGVLSDHDGDEIHLNYFEDDSHVTANGLIELRQKYRLGWSEYEKALSMAANGQLTSRAVLDTLRQAAADRRLIKDNTGNSWVNSKGQKLMLFNRTGPANVNNVLVPAYSRVPKREFREVLMTPDTESGFHQIVPPGRHLRKVPQGNFVMKNDEINRCNPVGPNGLQLHETYGYLDDKNEFIPVITKLETNERINPKNSENVTKAEHTATSEISPMMKLRLDQAMDEAYTTFYSTLSTNGDQGILPGNKMIESADVDWGKLEAYYDGLEKEHAEPKLILVPHLHPYQWKSIFSKIANLGHHNESTLHISSEIKTDWIEYTDKFHNTTFVYEAAGRKIEWEVMVVSAAEVNEDRPGSLDMHDDREFISLEAYLTLMAGRLARSSSDEFAKTTDQTWLRGHKLTLSEVRGRYRKQLHADTEFINDSAEISISLGWQMENANRTTIRPGGQG